MVRKYYIATISWLNLEVVHTSLIYGVPSGSRSAISALNIGDQLVFYIRGGFISNPCEVVSQSYYDDSSIFSVSEGNSETRYPHRIKLRQLIDESKVKSFKVLIPRMSFIKNKSRWGSTFMGRALIRISEEDFSVINRYLKNQL